MILSFCLPVHNPQAFNSLHPKGEGCPSTLDGQNLPKISAGSYRASLCPPSSVRRGLVWEKGLLGTCNSGIMGNILLVPKALHFLLGKFLLQCIHSFPSCSFPFSPFLFFFLFFPLLSPSPFPFLNTLYCQTFHQLRFLLPSSRSSNVYNTS